MAITAVGFDGSVDEAAWAQLMTLAGVSYAVAGPADYAITPVAGNRAVSVAAGTAYGKGVTAKSSAAQQLVLPTPAAGQWFLIVLRRDWQQNACTLEQIPGATTTGVTPTVAPTLYPAALNQNPGTLDDQPLYWAWVNNSSTTVTLFDLRNQPLETRLGALGTRLTSLENPPTPKHVEFILNRSAIPDAGDSNGVIQAFNIAVDAPKSTDTAFATMPVNGTGIITFNETGYYDLFLYGQVAAAPTGPFMVQFALPVGTGVPNDIQARGGSGSGLNIASVALPAFYAVAGSTLRVEIAKTSGSAAQVSGRVTVTKRGK